MKNTTTTTTKATKETKRQEQAKTNNEKRLATTKANIEQATKDTDNIVNIKAVATIQALNEHGKNSKEFVNLSQQLCCILVQSKLKRLYNNEKTSNEQQRKIKASISVYMDKNGQTKIDTAIDELNKLYIATYDENGNRKTICTDKARAQEIEKKITEYASIGNDKGHDLIYTAYLKLWEYIQKALNKHGKNIPVDYLLTPFEIAITRSKVYRNGDIKDESLWQYTTTNVIKEILKEISRQIESEKSITDTFAPYEEIQTEIDNESIRQYHRTSAIYCDTVTDFNGKITTITNNQTTEQLFESIPEKCNLSKMETIVLKQHYYNGKSFVEIADKYKVTVETIKKYNERIKNKIVASGIFAEHGLTEKANNGQKAETIYMFTVNNEFITAFESIGQASKTLCIDKGNISKCLKGQRKTANGYIFKYTK